MILYLIAQLSGVIQYTDCTSAEGHDSPPPNEYPGYNTKQSDGGGSDTGALRNVEHPFIAIVPRSTLVQCGST